MILPVYLSFVVPLAFLILVIQGEGRGIIVSFAFGMSSALAVYGITGFIDETVIPLTTQLAFVIPALEEFIKILPLIYLLYKANRTSKYSIVRYALAIGIGFSILENYMYLSMIQTEAVSSTLLFTIMRSLTASLLHGSTTALAGFCFQLMRNYSRYSPSLAIGIWLGGSVMHSLYNSLLLSPRHGAWAIVLPVALFGFAVFGINGFGIVKVARKKRQEGLRT